MSTVASSNSNSNSNSNSFTKAVINSTSLVEGDNGGIMKNTSGDFRVDCFTNFNKETSVDAINKGLINMLYQVKHSNDIGEGIADIFKLWCHKRHAREGEKEKLLSYRYFLELYDYYPNTMIEIAGSGLFGEIGYWKDYNLIWGMINRLEMSDSDRYTKYNKLIMSFRKALLTQRTNDLKEVSKFVSPRKLGDISNEEFDMIVLPGGGEGAQHLRDNFVLEAMLKSQKRRGGWIAGICASPSIVMASIGLIPEGAAATCYPAPSFQKIMTDNKVEYQDEDVVVVEEQKIITSKSPGTALHFALKCGEKLHGKKAADKVKSAILFNCCG